LLMAKLQTIIRAFTPEHTSLSFLFEKLNSAFFKDILPNSFASMIYIQINENQDKIELMNAGHLPPIVIKNGSLTFLEKGNVALGLTGNAQFKSETIKIKNGEYLIAFSDGVTEARDVLGNFFGVDRLAKFLEKTSYNSPEQLGQKLLNQVKLFIGDAKAHDDLSVVILKRENDLE